MTTISLSWGFCALDLLQDMLSDANPMVVANALAAMQEIQEVSGKEVLQITPHTLFKLLAALNECTEWGQVGRACTQESFAGMRRLGLGLCWTPTRIPMRRGYMDIHGCCSTQRRGSRKKCRVTQTGWDLLMGRMDP